MKRFILAALLPLFYLLSCLFSAFPLLGQAAQPFIQTTATAQTNETTNAQYACILRDDTYFYADKSERKGLFLLPKSYFVKILSVNTDYCQVEYGSITSATKPIIGYCKTEFLTFVEYTPNAPYFSQTFQVKYTLDGLTGSPFLTEITKTCAYYGKYLVGSDAYCYVLQEDKFGYVPLPNNFYVTENPEYYDRLKTESDETETPSTTKPQQNGNPVQTAILILLCVLIPVLAALILKPHRTPVFDPDDP